MLSFKHNIRLWNLRNPHVVVKEEAVAPASAMRTCVLVAVLVVSILDACQE